MHESLPGLRRSRRACLWLGLSRSDGCRADAEPDRRRERQASAQRFDLLRQMRKRLPDEDPAAQDDAPLPGARMAATALAACRPFRSETLGISGVAPAALSFSL